jgi:hypothetical protein
MKNEFRWDEWFSTASYREIESNSPALSSVRTPSCYSPDKKWFYLASQDIGIDTSDEEELISTLKGLAEPFIRALESKKYFNAWIIQFECQEICSLLGEITGDLDEYSDPSEFLKITA